MDVMEKLLESTTFGVGGAHYVYYKRGMHKEGGPVIRDSINKLIKHANVRSLANKYFKDMKRMSPSHEGISEKLMALAQQEREKEELVLRRLDPNKKTRYSQMGDEKFINKLNEFLGMGEKYKDYMRYLQEIYPNNQAKNLSPMVTSYFNQYFAQIFSGDEFMNELSKRVQKIVLNNGSQAQIDAACKDIGNWVADKFMANGADNRIFDEFIRKVEQTNHTLGEQEMFWVDIFEKIKQDEAVRNEFMSSLLQSYNIAGVLQKTIKSIKTVQNSKKMLSKGNIKKEINTSLHSTAYVKGGLYYEAVAVALQTLNLQGLGKGTVMGSSKITNAATTDSVALYTGELSVELRSELEKKYTELLEASASEKQQGIKVVRDFTKWVNENLKGSVLIYSNTKSYKLSSLSTGKKFFSGGRRKLSNLTDLITLDGGTLENANSFIDMIINTIPGAFYDGKQAEIKMQLSAILAQNIANLLFDDWETIGLQNATAMVDKNQNIAIHVFPLSGVMVPLSYLLKKAAEAFEKAETNMVLESNEYFRINFDLPNNIHFQDPKDTTAFINEYFNKHKPKGDVILSKDDIGKIRTKGLVEAWKLQSAEAMSGSSFGVDFLSNFNDLLQKLNDLL